MGLLDDFDFGGFDDSGDSSYLDNFDFGSITDDWYTDNQSSWDDLYDSSFELPGTTTNDDKWWKTVLDMANTPLGTGVIGGIAKGYLANQQNKAVSDRNKAQIDLINKHNASINRDHGRIAKVATFEDK